MWLRWASVPAGILIGRTGRDQVSSFDIPAWNVSAVRTTFPSGISLREGWLAGITPAGTGRGASKNPSSIVLMSLLSALYSSTRRRGSGICLPPLDQGRARGAESVDPSPSPCNRKSPLDTPCSPISVSTRSQRCVSRGTDLANDAPGDGRLPGWTAAGSRRARLVGFRVAREPWCDLLF